MQSRCAVCARGEITINGTVNEKTPGYLPEAPRTIPDISVLFSLTGHYGRHAESLFFERRRRSVSRFSDMKAFILMAYIPFRSSNNIPTGDFAIIQKKACRDKE